MISEFKRLSPQESVVLQMLWDGLRNKEIAQAMDLSVKTVKKYKDSLYKKLSVSHAMQLARRAVEHGLVPLNKVIE